MFAFDCVTSSFTFSCLRVLYISNLLVLVFGELVVNLDVDISMWDCGVVGMGVFFFVWPRGLVVFSFVVRQLLPKPNKNETNIDHKWD